MTVSFIPSQLATLSQTPLPYTANPRKLLIADFLLCLRKLKFVPGIFLPLRLGRDASPWDELYPSMINIRSILLHVITSTAQIVFVICLPLLVIFPTFWFLAYLSLFILANGLVVKILNGDTVSLEPNQDILDTLAARGGKSYDDEYWMYMNGVSVGRDWLQSNINRLTLTFGRKVHGVLNPTDGIVFDLFQCLIQRNLYFATNDIREAYVSIKKALYDEKMKKVVFILHSQGGIEGGLILDWLLAEAPQETLRKLEIYTFGCAANHFNNPQRASGQAKGPDGHYALASSASSSRYQRSHCIRAIGHLEHYANRGDFVSQIGVLNSVLSTESVRNRFVGRVFVSPESGHLMNQHYLHQMFALDSNNVCLESNDFMDLEVDVKTAHQDDDEEREDTSESMTASGEVTYIGDSESPATSMASSFSNNNYEKVAQNNKVVQVKQLSRLWLYRNGGSPADGVRRAATA